MTSFKQARHETPRAAGRSSAPAPISGDARPVNVVVGVTGGVGAAVAAVLAAREPDSALVGFGRRRPAGWVDGETSAFFEVDVTREVEVAWAAEGAARLGALRRVVVATGLLHAPGVAPEKSMRAMDPEAMARLFAVNAVGPAMVAKHLMPRMPKDRLAVFAALSARVGSISDNRLGGWYGYRASKAALNMVIATLAIEHRRTHPLGVCVALHPGTVDTALSAPFGRGGGKPRLSPDQSARALVDVIDGLGPQDTGRFLAWDGSSIDW